MVSGAYAQEYGDASDLEAVKIATEVPVMDFNCKLTYSCGN